MSKRTKAYAFLLITEIIWGIASPVIKYTVFQIKPFAFLYYRFLTTSAIFLPILIVIARREKETLSSLLKIAPLGFLGTTFTLCLIFLGLEKTTALDASILLSLIPIFVCVAGVLFLKEKLSRRERAGVSLAFAGTLVIVAQPFLEGGAFAQKNLIGNLLIIASNLVWTAYVVLSKEEFKKHSPFVITAVSFLTGLFTILPFAYWEQGNFLFNWSALVFSSGAFWGILYMSLFSSVLAYFTFQLGLSLIEASEAIVFSYLKPLFAAPLAIFWLGEKVTWPFILATFIIAAGIILAQYQPRIASRSQK